MSRSDREGQIQGPEAGYTDLGQLYTTYGGLVYAKAAGILRNRALAEDATQETWLRVSRALDRGVEPRDFQAWVLQIARREALRLAGRREIKENTRPVEELEDKKPANEREAAERAEFVQAALARLAPEDRALLKLRFLEGRSYKELRKLYGLSTSGVWDRVKRAIGHLRQAIRERDAAGLHFEVGLPFEVQGSLGRETGPQGPRSPRGTAGPKEDSEQRENGE